MSCEESLDRNGREWMVVVTLQGEEITYRQT